ncbi:MAG: hypothetical protein K6A42_01765 [Treponema sp.]|nr:hypothetical protein [Treponema sp.]
MTTIKIRVTRICERLALPARFLGLQKVLAITKIVGKPEIGGGRIFGLQKVLAITKIFRKPEKRGRGKCGARERSGLRKRSVCVAAKAANFNSFKRKQAQRR